MTLGVLIMKASNQMISPIGFFKLQKIGLTQLKLMTDSEYYSQVVLQMILAGFNLLQTYFIVLKAFRQKFYNIALHPE